jgi:hypothetical protein
MQLNWDAISASAELLGALAVIVTLIYLAVQLRQQNTVTQAQIEQENIHLRIILSPLRANFENTYRQFRAGYISEEFYQDVTKQLYLIHGQLLLRFDMPLTTSFRAELVRIIAESAEE